MQPLLHRRDAAQAVIDAFLGKALEWGRFDCGQLADAAMREMGHPPMIQRLGTYRTPLGAQRALRRNGCADPAAALDLCGFERIAPAMALPCDIVALQGAGGWPALTVAVGNGRVLGFHDGVGACAIIQPLLFHGETSAWRLPPAGERAPSWMELV